MVCWSVRFIKHWSENVSGYGVECDSSPISSYTAIVRLNCEPELSDMGR